MHQLELQSIKRRRRAHIEQIILTSIATAGILAVAIVAPNVVGAIHKLGITPKPRQAEYINAARRKLKREGLLIEKNGYLGLTHKGKKRLWELAPSMMLHKHARWDGRWRVLIFDIPERRRATRDTIRTHLRASGFARAQDSVWIYPYPCEDFVALLKAHCRVGKDMLYLIVDTMEGDAQWRKFFNLPMHDASPPLRIEGTAGAVLDTILPRRAHD